ncbi:MAG: glycosyltransferase [Candidatus Nanopelagicales bacterium]|nr:glycosyltransferase [Candidatus Nanopelagicales bacterium]MCF8539716.1 glycosyltransferase [Candidatus Nanopelagicales bacterium]MCF8550641.1 glycosyltransferase [Candidatus Nanopelagicales bacterium]
MIDVSVILIGFNDSQRLPTALQSIQQQSLRNIEIITVDDHSTDNSVEILQKAAARDPRIRVIQLPENSGGCSAPRNAGLAAAQGEFVMFCDSDDTLDPHACRNLLTAARTMRADLVVGTAERFLSDTGERKLWWPELHAQDRVVDSLSDCTDLLYDTISVNKIYRREFLSEHDITFPPGLLFEDQLFTARAYLAANRIGIISPVVYRWNVVRGDTIQSITQSRREMRNLRDRISINQQIDQLLEGNAELALAKHVKFLRHEASLYLTTIFESDSDNGQLLAEELAGYCRTIPVDAYDHVRTGIRLALYYLLADDFENLVTSLWWDKGGGALSAPLEVTAGAVRWLPSVGEQLGRPDTWWRDIADLHVDLIPPGRMRFFHVWEDGEHLVTADPLGLIPDSATAEMLFIESRNGAVVTIPLRYLTREEAQVRWAVRSSEVSLIQDRGIKSTESGTVVVEIASGADSGSWINRSPVTDRAHVHHNARIELRGLASADCADSLALSVDSRGALHWAAQGSARSLGSVLRKVRRKVAPGFTQRPASFELPTDSRPIVVFAPAPLPDFDSRLERFDTMAWIEVFGTSAFLLIPQESFTPAPARFTYAYRTYSPQRFPAALAAAQFVITDSPELLTSDNAVAYREDLGAARYLLPALDAPALQTTQELHERMRELIAQYQGVRA